MKFFSRFTSSKVLDHTIKFNFAQQICLNHQQIYGIQLFILIVALLRFFMFHWENERSAKLFVAINVQNMRMQISIFGEAHLMLSLTITFSILLWFP